MSERVPDPHNGELAVIYEVSRNRQIEWAVEEMKNDAAWSRTIASSRSSQITAGVYWLIVTPFFFLGIDSVYRHGFSSFNPVVLIVTVAVSLYFIIATLKGISKRHVDAWCRQQIEAWLPTETEAPTMFDTQTVSAGPEGIRHGFEGGHRFHEWRHIASIDRMDEYVRFTYRNKVSTAIPASAFEDAASFIRFGQRVVEWQNAADHSFSGYGPHTDNRDQR